MKDSTENDSIENNSAENDSAENDSAEKQQNKKHDSSADSHGSITSNHDITSKYNYDADSGSGDVRNYDNTFIHTSSDASSSDTSSLEYLSEKKDTIVFNSSEIIIVGTAHVSEKSVNEVAQTIKNEHPDVVAVELCQSRYESLKGNVKESELPIKDILTNGKIYYLLVHLILAYLQKKIGDEMGVKPGAEMMTAIDIAEANNVKIALVDRDIQLTIQRFLSKMAFFEKIKMLIMLLTSIFGIGSSKMDIDIDNLTNQDVVTMVIDEMRKVSPSAATVLIDERDAYIANNLVRLSRDGNKKIVAILGAGHKQGVERHLRHPESIPSLLSLVKIPPKRFNFMKIIGFGIVGIAIATFLLLIVSGTPINLLILAFGWWVLINGVLSAVGAALARGHPYSIITAFLVAWLTSLNPLMAAGWFAGIMEAKQRSPTTSDFKEMIKLESFKELQGNNFFRVILVAAFANIGSTIGTFLGIYIMVQITGLDPTQIIENGLTFIGL